MTAGTNVCLLATSVLELCKAPVTSGGFVHFIEFGGTFVNGTMQINAKGHLTIGGCDVVELAQQYGTPLYVFDEEAVRQRAEDYKQALGSLPKSQIIYAGKAFLTVGMAALAKQLGLGLDVVSGGELYTALEAEFPPEDILFHGNNKSISELQYALDAGVGRIVVDSFYELQVLSQLAESKGVVVSILLRLTPGVEAHTHSYIQTGQLDSKFGLAIGNGAAMEAVREAQGLPNIQLMGVHCHIGSQIFDTEAFDATVLLMMDFMAAAAQEGHYLSELDLGGGLGIRHTNDDDPMDVTSFGRFLAQRLQEAAQERGLPLPKLLIEPGRSLVGEAGTTLYTVGVIKELPGIRTYASVDGGMTDNPRVSLYQAVYEGLVANKMEEEAAHTYTVAGKCCESGDKLLFDVCLPQLESGDILAVPSTGAYNYSMSSNYNQLPRPAVVCVYDGTSEIMVEREQYQDLVRLHKIPQRWR